MAADIHGLEIEFAKSPNLDNCIPLCEAYLGAKRFMEAMVVCKKGIKGSPADPRGRVLLARVYAGQGKLPKAEQELTGMLTEFPNNPLAFEMMGQVLVQQGRGPEAVPYLQQAVGADPSRALAVSLLQQLGVQAMPAPAPQPMPQMAPPGMPGAGRVQQPAMQGYPQAPPPTGRPAVPGRPPARPPQMPPGYRPSVPPAWGAPGAPGAATPMQQPQGGMPPMPQAAPAFGVPAAPAESAPKLEHVSDFFAEEALGFSHDVSESAVETAGPGRLTILGFVPKSTGSIKTTIFVALAVFAVAAAVVFWQYDKGQKTRRINKLYGQVKLAMDEDRYNRYHEALKDSEEILKIDNTHGQTLGAMAYAYAILGSDHQEDGALNKAKELLRRADDTGETATEYRVAARALLRYTDKEYDKGVVEVKDVIDRGGSGPMVELEAFRLMNATKPDDRETQKQMARLKQILVNQVRAFNYLGWYYYGQEDWANADRYFAQTLQNSKDHPVALLGQALTDLDRGIGLRERQQEIGQNIKKAHVLPKDEYSRPLMALAFFTRAQLLQWQNKVAEAEADYKEAFKLDPTNATMFYYRRGYQLMKLGNAKEAVENLRKAAQADPNNPRYYKKLCDAQIKTGDSAGAKASCDRAAQFAAKDPEIKLLIADRLRADKKWDDAIAAYKSIPIEETPADLLGQAQIGISAAYRDSGKKPQAIQQLEGFMEKAPGIGPEMQAKIWCELGLSYEQTKNKEKATQCYDIGIEQFRFYPDCHYFKCRLLGKGPEAKEECKLYLSLDPRGAYADDAGKRAGPLSAAESGPNPPGKRNR